MTLAIFFRSLIKLILVNFHNVFPDLNSTVGTFALSSKFVLPLNVYILKNHIEFAFNTEKSRLFEVKMPSATDDRIENVGKILNNSSRPMKERFRALFTLKNIKGELAIKLISQAFSDDSDLLKHELAYCLGQMQDPAAIPVLIKVLEDVREVPMVRHEAGKFLTDLQLQNFKTIS